MRPQMEVDLSIWLSLGKEQNKRSFAVGYCIGSFAIFKKFTNNPSHIQKIKKLMIKNNNYLRFYDTFLNECDLQLD